MSIAATEISRAPPGSDAPHSILPEFDHQHRPYRVVLAALTAGIASYFVGALQALSWLALVVAFELMMKLFLAEQLGRWAEQDAQKQRAAGVLICGLGASIYLLGWFPSALTGRPGSEFFMAMSLAGTMTGIVCYRSENRSELWACAGPPIGAAVLALFATSTSWPLLFVMLAATLPLTLVVLQDFAVREGLTYSLQRGREEREAAEQANKAKSQFLATMSHELRTPLTAVIGYAEILEEDLSADGRTDSAGDAARIRRAARDLLMLINEVLDFSKIEAGRMDIVEAPAEPMAIVADVVETCRHIAEANATTVTVAQDGPIGVVVTDAVRLRQCVLNLVSNACKFTSGGKVAISVSLAPANGRHHLIVEVEDSGRGIAPEQAARLFQPFVQVDAGNGGTGLGLVITRRLAQLMGGDVSFTSALDRGSTFTLRLAVDAAHRDEEGDESPLILVIEDESAARDLICRTLARLPFRVSSVTTAAAGLEKARTLHPALVVLDIHLPDRSGWEVLAELRASGVAAPVLVLSVDDDRGRALSLGACEHLLKPMDRDKLAAAVLRFALRPAAPAVPLRRDEGGERGDIASVA